MKIWLWFEIIIIFINRTLNLQRIRTLSQIHIYSKMIDKKTCYVLGELEKNIITYYKKNCSKIHL
jgi:hypothetical protein